VQVTDNLPDSIFNYPLSIRRPIPDGWLKIAKSMAGEKPIIVTQGDSDIEDSIVTVSSKSYITFKAIPDKGDVIIKIKSPTSTSRKLLKEKKWDASKAINYNKGIVIVDRNYFKKQRVTITAITLSGKIIFSECLENGENKINLNKKLSENSSIILKASDGKVSFLRKISLQ
ncbi:MAG: hypothetical protein N2053_01015, partial [Chitinispirillaceae bacterium]|nr:hypothetical protein [Chitinispirillaceae bacterium]